MYAYCEKQYLKTWKKLTGQMGDAASESKRTEVRRGAQRQAIDKAVLACFIKYADDIGKEGGDQVIDWIWSFISAAHKYNLAHLQDFGLTKEQAREAYDRCISAHQSWNKSSGHSFERLIAKIDSPELSDNEICFLLESEVVKGIKNGKFANTESDLQKIMAWGENFDLFAVQTIHKKTHVFGCLQCKTSIRDRVGRDNSFAEQAMAANFWVAEIVLNGDFFHMPKYHAMINGGSTTYPTNTWHGVYVLAGMESAGRIYRDDDSFHTLANHAIQAAQMFTVNRMQLTRNWKAES